MSYGAKIRFEIGDWRAGRSIAQLECQQSLASDVDVRRDETRASLLAWAQRPRRQVDVEVVWVIVSGCGHQRHPAFAADVARFPAHVGMHRAHVLSALGGGTIAGPGADSVNEGSEAKKRNRADAEGKDAAHRSILTADLAWLAIRS